MGRLDPRRISPFLTVAFILLIAVLYFGSEYYDDSAAVLVSHTGSNSVQNTEPENVPGSPEESSYAEVYFFNVGQGDCELITVGNDFAMLIDAGTSDAWESIQTDLDALHITDLDVVVATHPHADHIGSMTKVIQNYDIGIFYMPVVPDDQTPTTRTYEKMMDVLLKKGVNVQQIIRGTEIPAPEGASFEVLSPEKDDRWEGINNYSAVIRFTYGDFSVLLAGDAEKEIERRILAEGDTIAADILKCGHHGSFSSTTVDFLEAVAPGWAVISCAPGNDYGYPHRETMKALTDYGCEILRTDTGSSFVARTDGKTYWVSGWMPESSEALAPAA